MWKSLGKLLLRQEASGWVVHKKWVSSTVRCIWESNTFCIMHVRSSKPGITGNYLFEARSITNFMTLTDINTRINIFLHVSLPYAIPVEKWHQFRNKQLFYIKNTPFFPSWRMQHTASGIPFNFCSNYIVCFKMLMQKVLDVYIVFDILSNSIQEPNLWSAEKHHLSNESPHHLANIPIKQSQKLPGWNEHYLQFMLWHNSLIFPEYVPNQLKKWNYKSNVLDSYSSAQLGTNQYLSV